MSIEVVKILLKRRRPLEASGEPFEDPLDSFLQQLVSYHLRLQEGNQYLRELVTTFSGEKNQNINTTGLLAGMMRASILPYMRAITA